MQARMEEGCWSSVFSRKASPSGCFTRYLRAGITDTHIAGSVAPDPFGEQGRVQGTACRFVFFFLISASMALVVVELRLCLQRW